MTYGTSRNTGNVDNTAQERGKPEGTRGGGSGNGSSTKPPGRGSTDPARLDFARAVIDGLRKPDKSLPCRFLYDARGSELFEEITRLPEYYPTRTEARILRNCSAEIAATTAPGTALIEFGSGSSSKTEILLEALHDLKAYVPIDISSAALDDACDRLELRFPGLAIVPVVADFSRPVLIPATVATAPKMGFFPGSTLGNLERGPAIALLASMRETLGVNARLIIGIDLKKDRDLLLAAYNDAAGVTAAFNLNILAHANHALGANFDPDNFRHEATYDEDIGRIDMTLIAKRDCDVEVLGYTFHFSEGERIHTEHSHKYDIDGFQALAREAGWRPEKVWTDPERLFSVHDLRA